MAVPISSSIASSSSAGAHTPCLNAFWVCQPPEMDHNGAFKKTLVHFEARLEALRASGVPVVSQVFEVFTQVANFIETTYPNGIDLLGFRMHADERTLPLSRQSGGSYSLGDSGTDTGSAVQNIFRSVRKFVMIEGCKTGSGKEGILKHVVSLCRPGVIGIGSKGSEFEVGFDKTLSGYMRFESLQSKQDITRIYYKTENGAVQNIPVDELMLLWDLFKEKCETPEEKQRGFELCYKLLGERNDPSTFPRIRSENKEFIDSMLGSFESIRKELLQVQVTKSGAKSIWVEMLVALEALRSELGGDQGPAEIPVDEVERAKTPDQIVTPEGALRVAPWSAYQKVYRFVLGCAFIDKYKPLLMLLDDETGFGPASQGIKALSGLVIHGNDGLSITTILAHYFTIIKKSYSSGINSHLIKDWFIGISNQVCFNNTIKFIDEFYEERIRPSREERLRIAILKGDKKEVQNLLEQGVNLNFFEAEGVSLYNTAFEKKFLFIAFLLHEKLYPDQHSDFKTRITGLTDEKILDSEAVLISNYLARNQKIKNALEYVGLIISIEKKVEAASKLAVSAALLGYTPRAIKILKPYFNGTISVPYKLEKARETLDKAVSEIVKIKLDLRDSSQALEALELFRFRNYSNFIFPAVEKVFNILIEKNSLEEVAQLFRNKHLKVRLDKILEIKVKELLDQGKYDLALQFANAIEFPDYFEAAYGHLVTYLIEQNGLDAAVEAASKLAVSAALLGYTPRAIKILKPYFNGTISVPYKLEKARETLDKAVSEIVKIKLDLRDSSQALEALELFRFRNYSNFIFPAVEKVFNILIEKNSLEEVAQLFRNKHLKVRLDKILEIKVKELLDQGKYDLALQFANAIEFPDYFEAAYGHLVTYLIEQNDLDAAYDLALRIKRKKSKSFFISDVISAYLTTGRYESAIAVADKIETKYDFNRARTELVDFFLKENKTREAYEQAMKIKGSRERQALLSKVERQRASRCSCQLL